MLRAVSYVGAGPEPGWLDKMLGAEAMPMKQAEPGGTGAVVRWCLWRFRWFWSGRSLR